MRLNTFIFISTLTFFHCTSHASREADVKKNSQEPILNNDSALVKDTTAIIRGISLFKIDVHKFFKQGSINTNEQAETSLKYLMPLSFYKDSTSFYIPDKSRISLNIVDTSGKLSGSIKIPLNDFTPYKLERFDRSWYLIDIEKGVYVFDPHLAQKYEDEKTVDFHTDKKVRNVYFQNMIGEERALLDQKGVLKSPLKIDYLSCYIDDSMLFGITDKGGNEYAMITRSLKDNSQSDYYTFQTPCQDCFIMPTILDPTHILSSTNNPSIRDQVTIANASGTGDMKIKHYQLEYPAKFNRLVSDASASISYSGFIYFYYQPTKTLYSLCTDKTAITVFSFDLSQL